MDHRSELEIQRWINDSFDWAELTREYREITGREWPDKEWEWFELAAEYDYPQLHHPLVPEYIAKWVIGKCRGKSEGTPQATNEIEENILEALRNYGALTGEKLAGRAGYPYNSNLKGALSSMVKRGVIENTRGRGYHLPGL